MAKSVRERVAVTGQVQGVGFRPFVYRLAVELDLTGWVINDSRGVRIEVQGASGAVETFSERLTAELPPLAQIARIERRRGDSVAGEAAFEIRPSEAGEMGDAQVTVDTATCEDCLREMRDPGDPRYRYPFINCTNCGPRYSIVRRIPYDRPNTTMSEFAMCPLCSREYADPSCRRFHAQPIACPKCGPSVWLVDTKGRQIACEDAIAAAAEMLRDGKIVAIKGLGGFHLACRADDQHAVGTLRRRKRRDAKPFALMAADLDVVRAICCVPLAAEKLLTGPQRPLVLMKARRDNGVATGVADGLDTLAVCLPYTPLHHLLFDGEMPPLVMTSGNYSDEPLVTDNDAAIAHLGGIADALVLHNRRIERGVDDSVVQAGEDGRTLVFRRARGYAPRPIRLDIGEGDAAAVLAVGAEFKNAVCLMRDGSAVLSEHVGDLKDGRVFRHFIDAISHLEQLFDVHPEVIAADLHPQYLSSEYAHKRGRGELAGREALPVVHVQHHHAHIVSCMAENGRRGPVIGLACDGVGYGDDGAVWGCEIMRADLAGYERLGHLQYLPLVGGDAAAGQTLRPAVAAVHQAFGDRANEMLARLPLHGDPGQIELMLEMLQADVSCPQSSSLGRWFDAVAAMCGLAEANRYEGEAPMRLEAAIDDRVRDAYSFRIVGEGPFQIELRPMVEGIVFDFDCGSLPGVVAAKFHNTVVRFLTTAARRAREVTGLDTVALSGGCFANRYLTSVLAAALAGEGLEVLTHRVIPCNDGGVALGQAVVAAAVRQGQFRRSERPVQDERKL